MQRLQPLTPASTNTGFFEEAQYRYEANATNPACIQATIFWQHGEYRFNPNGSITLYPFGSDGRIQVQNRCAAVTNIITYYNQQVRFTSPHFIDTSVPAKNRLRHMVCCCYVMLTDGAQTLLSNWGITVEPSTGRYRLITNRFDGAKMPYMYLIAKPPNMLPTQVLTGRNASGQTITRRKRNVVDLFKRSAASPRVNLAMTDVGTMGLVVGVVGSVAGLGLGML